VSFGRPDRAVRSIGRCIWSDVWQRNVEPPEEGDAPCGSGSICTGRGACVLAIVPGGPGCLSNHRVASRSHLSASVGIRKN
jgi:hypothetical protein